MSRIQQTTATARLKQDYARIMRDPVPYVVASPMSSNILEWHYVVTGPEDTPYEGGFFHGKLVFPAEFPFKPPAILMMTPNGRFECNTRLCLTISDFHPDTWNPAWCVSAILIGLLSFMVENTPTIGSIETSDYTKRKLAAQSGAFNIKNKVFCELFPEIMQEIKNELKRRDEELVGKTIGSTSENAMGQAHNSNKDPQGTAGGTFFNLLVILSVAIFAYIVTCVVKFVSPE